MLYAYIRLEGLETLVHQIHKNTLILDANIVVSQFKSM